MRRRIILAVILLAVAVAAIRLAVVARDFDAIATAESFRTLRDDYTGLRAFLNRMPKGGDLHVHLSGAVYAERLIAWAAQAGLCVRLSDMFLVEPPCTEEKRSVAVADAMRDQRTFDSMVNAMSMRDFLPSAAVPTGHDQFFATFAKVGEVTWRITAEMTADLLRRYEAESVQYTELMLSFSYGQQRAPLAAAIRGQTDFAAMLDTLNNNGLDRLVASARRQVEEVERKVEALRACDPQRSQPGCKVSYRFIAQISRNTPIEDVFVQTALAAALIRVEPRVVALNFVQAEDNQIARRDYTTHMRIVQFLAKDVPVALHAGELWLGLVPPEDLTFHIREAVDIAGARRIGHGVDLAYERDMPGLIAQMRARPVAIEINLTSNDVILGVRGKDHPLPAYLAADVPVVISTDDAGVSRIDLTNEYFRAVRDYRLSYPTVKAIARNALIHSFLGEADKQSELARFDQACAQFERAAASRQSWPRNLAALLKAAAWLSPAAGW